MTTRWLPKKRRLMAPFFEEKPSKKSHSAVAATRGMSMKNQHGLQLRGNSFDAVVAAGLHCHSIENSLALWLGRRRKGGFNDTTLSDWEHSGTGMAPDYSKPWVNSTSLAATKQTRAGHASLLQTCPSPPLTCTSSPQRSSMRKMMLAPVNEGLSMILP